MYGINTEKGKLLSKFTFRYFRDNYKFTENIFRMPLTGHLFLLKMIFLDKNLSFIVKKSA